MPSKPQSPPQATPTTPRNTARAAARTPGRPRMPFDRILLAALEIVDEQGADALTLRALAQRLGSSTATLYRHVDNRADLLAHVVERVLGEVVLDEELLATAEWATACGHLATSLFDAIARHPNAAPLLSAAVPTGPHAMAFRERCLTILLAHGFTPANARTLTAALARFVVGFALQLGGSTEQQDADRTAGDRLRHADPAHYPAISRTAAEATVPLTEEFALGLDLLLRGMRDLEAEHCEDR
ncbi:TetR/AcrR family transcriptional regulator [Streptomyces sp. NPDC005576]|uniref:TetR/AcrR family transcriptional regulator n=1 Tax=Streptomyces sp. NPDC005576 TaxID=3364726 RepID=UPI0036C6A932